MWVIKTRGVFEVPRALVEGSWLPLLNPEKGLN